MLAFRWILGLCAVGLGGGFVFLVLVGNALRRSFGASPNGPYVPVLPVLAIVLLIAALIAPNCRPLLHLAALAALGLGAWCVWQIVSDAAVVLWFGIAYLVLWFVFYAQSLASDGGPA